MSTKSRTEKVAVDEVSNISTSVPGGKGSGKERIFDKANV